MRKHLILLSATTGLMLTSGASLAQPVDAEVKSDVGVEAGAKHENQGKNHFARLDTDGNGNLSQAEFRTAMKARHKNPAERFKKLDADGDGNISREEAKDKPRLTKHFDKMDSSGDGNVSQQEFSAAVKARAERKSKTKTEDDAG